MVISLELRRRDRSVRRSPRYELHLSPAQGEMSCMDREEVGSDVWEGGECDK